MFTWNIKHTNKCNSNRPFKNTASDCHKTVFIFYCRQPSFFLFLTFHFFIWTVSTVRVSKYIFKSCINTLYNQQLKVLPVQNIYPPKALFKINALKIKSRKSPNRCLFFLQLLKSSNVRHKSMLTVSVCFNGLKIK